MNEERKTKTPLDVAADVFVFAPIGLVIELGKQLPELARQGRNHLDGPIKTARFIGTIAANQGRNSFADKFRQAAEPFFSAADTPAENGTQPAKSTRPTSADLPISGYDTLSASQIATHLSDLEQDQLRRIREHELANRARKSVLTRIDALLQHP